MVEFTSGPPKSFNRIRILIALGVIVVLVGGVFLFVHYESGRKAQAGASKVVVPGLLRPGNTNFEYYKTRIRVENVKASLGISFNGARIAIITGAILNDGDRTLEAVELHVSLYDLWGKVSKERTAFALRPGAGYSGKPMKPLEKRPFTIGVESVEEYWDPKQISLEITGLKYE